MSLLEIVKRILLSIDVNAHAKSLRGERVLNPSFSDGPFAFMHNHTLRYSSLSFNYKKNKGSKRDQLKHLILMYILMNILDEFKLD